MIGVPVESVIGDSVAVHYVGSNPRDATVDFPPNRVLGLVMSAIFMLIGAGGAWSFGHDRPRPEYEV